MILEIPDHLKDDFITFLDMSASFMDALDLTESERDVLDLVREIVTREQGGYTELDEKQAKMLRSMLFTAVVTSIE